MVTKYRVPVTGYLPPTTKTRMERIAAINPRKSISAQIEEAMDKYLPDLEASFLMPTREARSGRKRTA